MPASVMTMPEATVAVQMHEAGYSQPQIAQKLGRTRKAVRTAFKQLGVQQRTPAEGYRAWLQLRDGRGNRAAGTVQTTKSETR